jgi:HEAT repeat protein
LDTGPYYIYGILVDEQLDRVIIKTVDFDGDVYNISQYYKPIFLTHISEIIIDYSIPDMLTLGPKSIEIPGLWNKLKYQKDSLMERYEQSYQRLRDLSDPKRKFSEISKIIQNAIESLQFYKDNSEIAKLYIETLQDVLNSIDNINEYIEENAQNLLFIKNLIRDNVYEAQFELSRIKQSNNNEDNEDNDLMVSALNNILFDTFQNDRDKFVRINSISSLIDIDYESYVSDMVNTLKNPAEPIPLRAFVFNILKTYGFPAYMQYSKEDLEKEKYRAIKIKLQEMYEALENYQNTIYEIASSALEVPDIYNDPNFSKNHYLRVLAVLSLGEFPTGESIELLINIVKTYYPYKLRHSNYNVIHKRLTNKLRKYALDTLVNKNNLNRGFVRSIEILLFNIIRNTEETIKIRTAASKGVGKLAIRARQITEETGKRLVIRPELIDVLLLSLITPNVDFRCAIVWSLGELGAEKSVDYLRSLILQDYIELEVKKSCLFALYKIRTEEAIDIIKNALYSQEEELENLARDLLKKLGLR